MPVEKAKGGKRWGKSGKVYTGKGAKKKAQKQGVAIMIQQGKIKPKGGAKNVNESADPSIAPRKIERDVMEFVRQDKPCRVDREEGVIYGVKLCGLESKNGGRYTLEALSEARAMYEGAKCNINHPERDKPGRDRLVADRFGIYHNYVVRGDGAYADLHYLKSHLLAEMVCEAAERMPEALGFSQNARTIQVPDEAGGVIHESIVRVRSVDLVADPATTSSIFESENPNMADPNTQAPNGEDGQPITDTPPEPSAELEQDPVDVAIDALLAKCLPTIKSTADKGQRKQLLNDLKKKIDAIIDALSDEAPEEEEPEEGPEGGEEPGGEEEAAESVAEPPVEKPKKDKPDYVQALDVLESAGVAPSSKYIKLLLAVPETNRAELAATWKTIKPSAAAKPKSGSVLESARSEPQKTHAPTAEQIKEDAMLLMAGSNR